MSTHTGCPNIVFIGGTGRSGTNITKEIFQKHPQVASLPFEYRFIIDPDGLVDFYRSYTAVWSPYLADKKIKRLEQLLDTVGSTPFPHNLIGSLLRRFNPDGKVISRQQYHGWELNQHLPNFQKHSQALINELKEFSFSASWVGTESYIRRPQVYHAGMKRSETVAAIFGNYICQLIDDLLQKEQKQFFIEDNTWNILFAHELLDFIPTAKILHVYRDPRDVVASLVQQRWSPSTVKEAALWYRSIMSCWFTVRESLPPESYFEYKLEALVHHPEDILKRTCHFTGIPYDDTLLQTNLSKSNTGRWRQDFNQEDQQLLQNILGDIIDQLGYPLN